MYSDLYSKYPAGLDSEPELSDLMNEVAAKIPSKWRDMGMQLGLDEGRLDAIALISSGNTNHCFSNVFTLWKNHADETPLHLVGGNTGSTVCINSREQTCRRDQNESD